MNRRKKMEKQATVKKELWESPRTEFEMFVPDMYCKNCEGLGHWEVVMKPENFHPSTQFYIDNGNGYFDKGDRWATTDANAPGGITSENISYGWVSDQKGSVVGDPNNPNIAFIYKGQGNQYYAYKREDVFFATEKS